MNQVLGDILPLALGVAPSPVPIIAVILMLFAPHARSVLLVIGVAIIGKGLAGL